MKVKHLKPIFALMLSVVLCLSLTSCDVLGALGLVSDEEEDVVTSTNQATAGGEQITLPEDFVMPETANRMVGALVGEEYVGTVYLSSYRSGAYVYIVGDTLTVDANFYLTNSSGESVKTSYQDVKIALWEKGTNEAIYVDTAHFVADGTMQSYTFTNLKPNGEYRIAVTYSDVGSYRVNGNFRLRTVSATGSEEETTASE